MDASAAGEHHTFHIHELEELRHHAYESSRIYQEQTKKYHNSRLRAIKEFKEGNLVLLFNLRLKLFPGNLQSRWSGPFTVTKVFPYGTIEVTASPSSEPFKVNGHRLKLYRVGDTVGVVDEVDCFPL